MNDHVSTVFVGGASELDCQLLSASLRRKGVRVIGTAFRADQIISGVSGLRPQAALISSRIEDGDFAGLRVVQEISSEPHLRCVMLVDYVDPELVIESFCSGAIGVFSRSNGSAELRSCIQKVLQGKPWVSDSDVLCLIDEVRKRPPRALGGNSNGLHSRGTSLLTKREEEVVELLLSGMTNREIATQLDLSLHTVKNHFFSIFEKVGVYTRVELLLYAQSHRNVCFTGAKGQTRVAMIRS